MNHRSTASCGASWQRLGSYLLPLMPILLAMALHLYGLESKSLWHDELGTLTSSGWNGSWLDAIRYPLTVPTLPKPPLSFMVTHLFLALGESVFLVRLPAALFATLTIPLVYVLGSSLFDRPVGLLGAFLLAIAPLQIRYAQEARMYAMLAFFSGLSLYLFWRAIEEGKGRWWVGFAVVSILNLYTHQFALLSLGVLTLFGLWLWLRARSGWVSALRGWHFFVALAAIGLAYLPMAPFFIEGLMSEEGLGGSTVPVYGELNWSLGSLLGAVRLFSGGSNVGLAVYTLLSALAVAAWVRGQWRTRQTSNAGREVSGAQPASMAEGRPGAGQQSFTSLAMPLSVVWVVLPVVIALSVPAGHGVRIRYLVFVLPVYLLIVAYGLRVAIRWLASRLVCLRSLATLRLGGTLLINVALLAILGGISAPSIASYYAETKQNWRDATWLVQASARPGEPVFVTRLHHQTGVLFYARQWTEGPNLLTEDNVRVLPKDPTDKLLPAGVDRGWLIAPYQEQFLPGGDFEAKIKPYYRLLPPVVLDSPNVPEDGQLIAPISYRSLAVVQVVRFYPPSIYFSTDDDTLAPGSCTRLRWEVENVREVYLNGDGVVGHGEREVCPTATTTYELKVVNLDDSVTLRTLQIAVGSP